MPRTGTKPTRRYAVMVGNDIHHPSISLTEVGARKHLPAALGTAGGRRVRVVRLVVKELGGEDTK